MISVRQAVPSDATAISIMMKMHRSEVTLCPSLTFDFQLCVGNVKKAIVTDGTFIIVAHDSNDPSSLTGYTWVSIVQPHFTDAYFMTEHYTYVKPAKRAGRTMKLLLHEAYVISTLVGCEYFQIACISGIDTCNRAYDKRFDKVGSVYHYKEGK